MAFGTNPLLVPVPEGSADQELSSRLVALPRAHQPCIPCFTISRPRGWGHRISHQSGQFTFTSSQSSGGQGVPSGSTSGKTWN